MLQGALHHLGTRSVSRGVIGWHRVFSEVSRHILIRWSFRLFALFLFLFAITSNFAVALPVSFVLGVVYFLLATAMMTELQHNLTDAERASIMPLWFMSFGGSIPIGNLLGGPIMDAVGATMGACRRRNRCGSKWGDL